MFTLSNSSDCIEFNPTFSASGSNTKLAVFVLVKRYVYNAILKTMAKNSFILLRQKKK